MPAAWATPSRAWACARAHVRVRGGTPAGQVALITLAAVAVVLAVLVPEAAVGRTTLSGSQAPISGFLASPTDQLSVPGMLAGAEVTPEGDLYTGWAEYELRFGRHLKQWNQPTRTLPDPGVPLLWSTLADGALRYTLTQFAVPVGVRAVAYETVTVRNDSAKAGTARVELGIAYTRGRTVRGTHGLPTAAFRFERPTEAPLAGSYEQPGQAFSPAFSYSVEGRDLDRSGLLLARGPALLAGAQSWASTPADAHVRLGDRARLDLSKRTPPAVLDTPTAAHDARLFTVRVGAHAQVSLTWQIPLEPPLAGAVADRALDRVAPPAALARLKRLWQGEEAGAMKIDVPERRVSAAYEAALAEILGSRVRTGAGWVQETNKLQYQELWIRDAALQLHALDLAGLHRQAGQDLAFMDTYQQPDGLFISRAGQYDGWGQALWALTQHAQLTRSASFAREQLGRMQAAISWLSAATALDPLGLLPAANPGDDELAFGHVTGDDLWAAAGLRAAIADAQEAGRSDLAVAWGAVDSRFETSLDGTIEAAVAREGHIPPVLDAQGGFDWGNFYAAYPVEVLASPSPSVRATLAWAREHMAQGIATYEDGKSLHDYLGFSVFETELQAGDRAGAVAGLYSELAHTTSTYGGWEWAISLFGYRGSPQDLSPHGTFAADYVALLRNMLVAERGSEVRLLSGASPAWLSPGERIEVSGAPTDRGLVSFEERASAHGEMLKWSAALAPSTGLTWELPSWARNVYARGRRVNGSMIALRGSRGSIAVTFDGRRPAQSYTRTVAALNALYRAHGQRAPLEPAFS